MGRLSTFRGICFDDAFGPRRRLSQKHCQWILQRKVTASSLTFACRYAGGGPGLGKSHDSKCLGPTGGWRGRGSAFRSCKRYARKVLSAEAETGPLPRRPAAHSAWELNTIGNSVKYKPLTACSVKAELATRVL